MSLAEVEQVVYPDDCDAFGHLKVIAHVPEASPLFERAGIEADEGVIAIGSAKDLGTFVAAAKRQRIWQREPSVRSPG